MQQCDLQGNVYDIQIHTSHEKTAKEMFEALGEELRQDSIDWLTYSANYEKWYEHNIEFNKKEKQLRISGGIVAMGRIITLDELKAINQQCKELGWLDE